MFDGGWLRLLRPYCGEGGVGLRCANPTYAGWGRRSSIWGRFKFGLNPFKFLLNRFKFEMKSFNFDLSPCKSDSNLFNFRFARPARPHRHPPGRARRACKLRSHSHPGDPRQLIAYPQQRQLIP